MLQQSPVKLCPPATAMKVTPSYHDAPLRISGLQAITEITSGNESGARDCMAPKQQDQYIFESIVSFIRWGKAVKVSGNLRYEPIFDIPYWNGKQRLP